ncbi:MAG: hypothetical protein C0513_02395 [Isosphaera sp.]|nr:hypothetical protein [Isosphaera sp.]
MHMIAPMVGTWADLSTRLFWLSRFRRAIAKHSRPLCDLVHQDVGKPPWEALAAELLPLLASCAWHRRRAPGLLRERSVGRGPVWALGQRQSVQRLPLGTVAIIATWNYPLGLLGVQLVQALLAGNRVLVKPSERAPAAQLALLQLAADCGLPPGVLRWTEPTRGAGPAMLDAGTQPGPDRIDHVVFTGSTAVGRHIAAWAAQHLIPTTLELSGSDSAIVLSDADPATAARSIFAAVRLNAGQTCTAPRRALVHMDVYQRLLAELAPLAAGCGPLRLIDRAAADHADRLVRDSIALGARPLCGVYEPAAPATADPHGPHGMRPAVLADCPAGAPLATEEHFAPALAVVPCASDGHALELHARAGQRLATAIFTRDTRRARSMAGALGTSSVTINDCVVPTAHPGVGIGGAGASGWGVTRGPEGLLALTRPVYVSRTRLRLRTPTGVPTRRVVERMHRLAAWLYGGGSGPAAPPLAPAHRADATGPTTGPSRCAAHGRSDHEVKHA